MFKLACIVAASVALPGLAHAQSVPAYDSQKFCEFLLAAAPAEQKPLMMKGCLQQEETRKGQLEGKLKAFPDAVLQKCDALARMTTGGGSYQSYATCLTDDLVDRFLQGKID